MVLRKIAILGAANSIHVVKWANSFIDRGYKVYLISHHQPLKSLKTEVKLFLLPVKNTLGYVLNLFHLKLILSNISPDILNVHYASGYGFLSYLSGFHPMVLSVWGADVYDFPKKTPVHKFIVKKNLLCASGVASTSHVMADHTRKIASNLSNIYVTPFGVDTAHFIQHNNSTSSNVLVIGTVKTLAYKYGIDILIQGFHLLTKDEELKFLDLRLVIVGKGDEESKLKELVFKLEIELNVTFVGFVSNDRVPEYLNLFDIYAAPSRLDSESFGVAIVEASSCSLPVVVSDVGGLPEVVRHGETGFVVSRESSIEVARALKKLALSPSLRKQMGSAGRKWVEQEYEWEGCLDKMISCYENCLKQ